MTKKTSRKDVQNILVHAGLSEKESAVYLAACELGATTAGKIATKSGVNRATTYVCLDSLKGKGFMATSDTSKKTIYLAERPERIAEGLRMSADGLEQTLAELRDAMPMIDAIYNVEGNRPQVMFVDGAEGLARVHEEFSKLRGPYVMITNIDDAQRALKDQARQRRKHQEELRNENVEGRSLLVSSRSFQNIELPLVSVDVKFLEYTKFPIHGEVVVREDTIILFSYKQDPFMNMIRSKTLADTFRALFELAWLGAQNQPGRSRTQVRKGKM